MLREFKEFAMRGSVLDMAVGIILGGAFGKVTDFAVVALALFLLIRQVNRLRRSEERASALATMRECPFCLSPIPLRATRCSHCTSEVRPA